MNGQIEDCPIREDLFRLLDDADNCDPRIATHVDICARCQQQLELLTESALVADYREHSRYRAQAFDYLEPPLREGDLGSLKGLAIESEIGRGGMGVVFRGWDASLERSVAVKLLHRHDSAGSSERFQRECRAMASLQHPNVVPVYSSGYSQDGIAYLVMPLVEGRSLKAKIAGQAIEQHDAARLIRQVALGLEAAHQANLIHRDVKPENILLDYSNNTACLTDFGLVRTIDSATLTQVDLVAGTPPYMSPEQIADPIGRDPRSDVYSLGITLYECLTGSTPFTGPTMQVLEQHRDREPIPPSRLNRSLSRDLENICLMAIAKDCSRRYQTAGQFAEDLDRFLNGRPVEARETTSLQRASLWCKRNPALTISFALLLTTLTIGIATTSYMWRSSVKNANEANARSAEAQHYAANLEASRQRLRKSVSRFQQRIFSEQAMHWQMTDTFRSEMFKEVMEYLNEFALIDEREGEDGTSYDSLTQDYLSIAKAGFIVSDFAGAEAAASIALERARLKDTKYETSLEGMTLHYEVARLYRKILEPTHDFRLLPSEPAADSILKKRMDLASECRVLAENALLRAPNEVYWQLAEKESRFRHLTSTHPVPPNAVSEIQRLYAELEATEKLNEHREKMLNLATQLGWWLSSHTESEVALDFLNRNLPLLEAVRDRLRTTHRPLTESDIDNARHFARMALIYEQLGDIKSAVQFADRSNTSFLLALNQLPNNRLVVRQANAIDLKQCDWHVRLGELTKAGELLTAVIKRHLTLAKSDPDNYNFRVTTIKLFIKMADLSDQRELGAKSRQEYYIASQDCRDILKYRDDLRAEFYKIRCWLASETASRLNIEPNEAFEKWQEHERNYHFHLKELGYDTTDMERVLNEGLKLERPAGLDFFEITESIFAMP